MYDKAHSWPGPVPDNVLGVHAKMLIDKIRKSFENPAFRAEFEAWQKCRKEKEEQ